MIRTGIDILKIERFEKYKRNKNFLEKVFHNSELKENNRLAGIFALKEAAMKAIGKKLNWKDIEITRNKDRPIIKLSDEIKPTKFKGIDGSVSHDGDYVCAVVILELHDDDIKYL